MFEMSVSSKLFPFLVGLYPSEEKAVLFAQNLKLVLESLGEGCFLQSVSTSLFCFCIVAGVERHYLGISVCLKSFTVICAKDLSLEYRFGKWFIICSVHLHRGKSCTREEKICCLFHVM